MIPQLLLDAVEEPWPFKPEMLLLLTVTFAVAVPLLSVIPLPALKLVDV